MVEVEGFQLMSEVCWASKGCLVVQLISYLPSVQTVQLFLFSFVILQVREASLLNIKWTFVCK